MPVRPGSRIDRRSTGRTRPPRKPLIAARTGPCGRASGGSLRGYAIAPGYTTDPIEKAVFVGFR
jgi:hypothetical protein